MKHVLVIPEQNQQLCLEEQFQDIYSNESFEDLGKRTGTIGLLTVDDSGISTMKEGFLQIIKLHKIHNYIKYIILISINVC